MFILKRFVAVTSLISVLAVNTSYASMYIYDAKHPRGGNSVSLDTKGHWEQVGNDWGYSIDEGQEGLLGSGPLGGLIQKGSFYADGDWYFVNKDTHTIERNVWKTGNSRDYEDENECFGARTYYGADGKAEKIQFPLRNGYVVNGQVAFDESSAAVYDLSDEPDEMAKSLIQAVNEYRVKHGAANLKNEKVLMTTSKIFSTYLPMDSKYQDQNPRIFPFYRATRLFLTDGTCMSSLARANLYSNEFISVGKWDVNEIVQEWATHEIWGDSANLTVVHDINYAVPLTDGTHVGAACYVDANGTPYWYMQIA